MKSIVARVLHKLGQAQRIPAVVEFERAARQPRQAQQARCLAAIRPNEGTEFGQKHGFASVRSIEEYRARVPIMMPEEAQRWVQRLMKGERNVLTAEPPLAYVSTTGSTGRAKAIPVTRSYKREYQKTTSVSVWHVCRKFPNAFTGPILYQVGARRDWLAEDGLDVGAMSGFNFTEMPAPIRKLYAWPYELFEIEDLRTRSFLMLQLAALAPVTIFAGIFPVAIVHMFRDYQTHAAELAEHIERGSLPSWAILSEKERAVVRPYLHPRPDVAARLSKIESDPEGVVRYAFPELKLVYCWKSAAAALFMPELEKLLGPDIPTRDAIYAACEGWCSIPMGDEEPGGALAITSHFFEFIEPDAWERGERDTKLADELEEGKQYLILITNSTGLYRYFLGDVIEVCGFYHRAPKIRFVRKNGACANLYGEKLEELHANQALMDALRETGFEMEWACLVPGSKSEEALGYDLVLEPKNETSLDRMNAFARAVDDKLRARVFVYDLFRKEGTFRPMRLRALPCGAFREARAAAVARGAAESQIKVTHLVADFANLPAEIRRSLERAGEGR